MAETGVRRLRPPRRAGRRRRSDASTTPPQGARPRRSSRRATATGRSSSRRSCGASATGSSTSWPTSSGWSPGIVPVPGNGRSRFQPLAVRDLAAVVLASAVERRAHDRADSTSSAGHATGRIARSPPRSCRAMVRRRAIVPMPIPLIRLVARDVRGPPPAVPGRDRPAAPARARQHRAARSFGSAFGFEPQDMAGNLGYLRRRKAHQEPDPV